MQLIFHTVEMRIAEERLMPIDIFDDMDTLDGMVLHGQHSPSGHSSPPRLSEWLALIRRFGNYYRLDGPIVVAPTIYAQQAARYNQSCDNPRTNGPMVEVPDNFSWPEPWKPLPLPEGWLGLVRSAEVELQSEICPGHLLYGQACRVVAFNSDDVNEFLFVTGNSAAPLAFVHLTFRAESDPKWPYTVCYDGWESFSKAWQLPG
jgi:hypothetical protein